MPKGDDEIPSATSDGKNTAEHSAPPMQDWGLADLYEDDALEALIENEFSRVDVDELRLAILVFRDRGEEKSAPSKLAVDITGINEDARSLMVRLAKADLQVIEALGSTPNTEKYDGLARGMRTALTQLIAGCDGGLKRLQLRNGRSELGRVRSLILSLAGILERGDYPADAKKNGPLDKLTYKILSAEGEQRKDLLKEIRRALTGRTQSS